MKAIQRKEASDLPIAGVKSDLIAAFHRSVARWPYLTSILSKLGLYRLKPSVEAKVAASARLKEEVVDGIGLANLINIHQVLDNLPTYFRDLKALRRVDEDAYNIFSRLGGQITIEDDYSKLSPDRLPSDFLENPPGIRCLFFTKIAENSWKTDKITLSIFYMMKMGKNQSIVDRDGSFVHLPDALCYQMVFVWILKGKPLAERIFVRVDSDSVRLICHSRPERQILRNGGSFTARVNRPSKVMSTWARDNDKSVDEMVKLVFHLCASAQRPKDAILVRATMGKTAAAWTIDKRDAKRFFVKREGGVTDRGARKRVLHFVGSFDRVVQNAVQNVRAHYRGEREFNWMGYSIKVSGLGFHHGDFFDASLDLQEVDDDAERPGMLTMKQASKSIRARYDQPKFLTPKRGRGA
jgi:hypothetical protein